MDPARKSYNIPDAAFGYGPALKVGVGFTIIVRYTPEGHIYYQYLQTLSPVAHGRLNLPAEMPGPTHKQKIVRVLFHKRAIELQTAVKRPPCGQGGSPRHFNSEPPCLQRPPRDHIRSRPRMHSAKMHLGGTQR